ncbi:hypothetical protein Salat_2151100 [Sesamum alatum]|uniref:Uncharacterized protein n=1 Tax=Sesamum alatum TaxID=300844 RepID=A0AAE1Y1M6_9LAMI|nr:hypothetical protein Salat_2151100 [Sesamum alatum]
MAEVQSSSRQIELKADLRWTSDLVLEAEAQTSSRQRSAWASSREATQLEVLELVEARMSWAQPKLMGQLEAGPWIARSVEGAWANSRCGGHMGWQRCKCNTLHLLGFEPRSKVWK